MDTKHTALQVTWTILALLFELTGPVDTADSDEASKPRTAIVHTTSAHH
jgi:hypothetical protein